MPHYMDRHDAVDASAEELAQAHLADLTAQERYGVDFLTYWYDNRQHKAYCLVRAPNPEAAIQVHAEAHGNLPADIIEVDLDEVFRLLGRVADPTTSQAIQEAATRTIVFTDMVGSTARIDRFGDEFVVEMIRLHDQISRSILEVYRGREVKHTGDGLMLAFDSPSGSVRFAIELQRRFAEHSAADPDHPIAVRVGINTGEPVTEGADPFGVAVNVAARLCERAEAGAILVSEVVRGLTMGKGFEFGEGQQLELKGFAEPIRACPVIWQDS